MGADATCAQVSLGARSLRDHATIFGLVPSKNASAASRAAAKSRCEGVWDVL